jgi:hypothetical protein
MKPIYLYVSGMSLCVLGSEPDDRIAQVLSMEPDPAKYDSWKPRPMTLTPRAVKRLSLQTLLAISAAEQLQDCLMGNPAWVFGSAFGEGETLKVILDALCKPEMAVRPLRFQNSVHNAASGQWTIAAQTQAAATSICAGPTTAAAGLLKAAMQAVFEQRSVGLVLYDAPLPAPLDQSHKVTVPGSAGIALSASQSDGSLSRMKLSLCADTPTPAVSKLGAQTNGGRNPSLGILPVIERLASLGTGAVVLPLTGASSLKIEVTAP